VIPLGALLGGALASAIGLRETMIVGAIGGALAVVPILLSPVRSVGLMSEVAIEPIEPIEPQSAIASASSAQA
jgi:predicted lipid-binding transport protein (Tim44 family)